MIYRCKNFLKYKVKQNVGIILKLISRLNEGNNSGNEINILNKSVLNYKKNAMSVFYFLYKSLLEYCIHLFILYSLFTKTRYSFIFIH